ncbi:hypothetical protein EDB81DRAFT_34471 [Dactylonectria macrodidyma]|uniref:Uncharacterized protein n=1 Tax=Dactylonectria macrodidyma TaxID=307937 RepID=A0A9P9FSG4_9HYPO|nr:hypothetical protein EDB81DRAFT_34471 [Dactylonectria macrodidyma]
MYGLYCIVLYCTVLYTHRQHLASPSPHPPYLMRRAPETTIGELVGCQENCGIIATRTEGHGRSLWSTMKRGLRLKGRRNWRRNPTKPTQNAGRMRYLPHDRIWERWLAGLGGAVSRAREADDCLRKED